MSNELRSADWAYLASYFPFLLYHRVPFLKGITHMHKINVRSIAEIGVWKGESSSLFSALFPSAQLYLIDLWKYYPEYGSKNSGPSSKNPEDFERAYKLVKEKFHNYANCTIIRKKSSDAVIDVPNDLDLIFIDANHSYKYVKEDIHLWSKKVKKGGIIAGHDYSSDFPGVMEAVKKSFKEFEVGVDHTWYHINK